MCVVNPYQMKKYGDVEIRKAKTDKKDALRIPYSILASAEMFQNLSLVNNTFGTR